VGFGLAQAELTDLMNRIRQPFNTNSMAQAAAIAAIADDAFVERSYQLNRDGLAKLQSGFAALGLQFVPSYGNFVLVRVGNAGAVYEGLLRKGVIVRPVGGYGLPEWLRVSVGLPEENDRLLAALAQVMGRAG
jgi:histidinol-phosphate aminotransferase